MGAYDPNILLKMPAQQWPDPLKNYERRLTLRDMIEQRKFRELERQEKQQQWEHQQAEWQRADRDRQRQEDALRYLGSPEAIGKTPEQLLPGLLQRYGTTGLGIGKALFEQQKEAAAVAGTRATTAKTTADTEKEQQARIQNLKEQFSNGMAAVAQERDPQKKQQMYWGLVADLRSKNFDLWDNTLEQIASSPVPATDQDINRLNTRVRGPDWVREQAAKQAVEADRAENAVLEREKQRAELTGTLPVTQYQRATLAQQAMPDTPDKIAAYLATNPNLPPDQRKQLEQARDAMIRQRIQTAPQNIPMSPEVYQQHKDLRVGPAENVPGWGDTNSPLSGDEFLQTLAPGNRSLVEGTVRGDITFPSANSRAPGAQQLRRAVLQYDPKFSEQRAQVRKAFTTGPDGRNIGALNTAIVHLGRLAHAGEALNNGTFTPGNEMYQYFRDKFGSATATNFTLLKDAVAGEMANALKGNATDPEINNMKQSIRAANSPEQMLGVVKEGMAILADKAKTYDERYHQQMPDDQVWSPVLPTARDTLNRFGVPWTGSARGAGGAGKTATHVYNPATGKVEVKH